MFILVVLKIITAMSSFGNPTIEEEPRDVAEDILMLVLSPKVTSDFFT